MTGNTRNVFTKNIKKHIEYKGTPVLSVNLKYPEFEELSETKAERAFVSKMNKFYAESARRYLDVLSKSYVKNASKIFEKNGNTETSCVMNYNVAYSDDDIVSAFVDISGFDGNAVKTSRFPQLWSREKSAILPASYVMDTSSKSKTYLKELITEIADKNAARRDFSYYDNYRSIIKRKFDVSNFYIVPNGVAFFYDNGLLSASMGDVCVFVLPSQRIDGLLKITL